LATQAEGEEKMGSRASCFAPQAGGEEKMGSRASCFAPQAEGEEKMGSRASCFAPQAEGEETYAKGMPRISTSSLRGRLCYNVLQSIKIICVCKPEFIHLLCKEY
jgi:hypothetical protein